ncbi:hypothetical protein [Rhodovulum euryhalinum]|uniref:hypothetical protein n=1 Tax=Rhodovulum euryhalinum TaxID=35805 RepID=UPI00104A361E|nr:hypothetical protein [Rhodovulum euryhalinum]
MDRAEHFAERHQGRTSAAAAHGAPRRRTPAPICMHVPGERQPDGAESCRATWCDAPWSYGQTACPASGESCGA